MLTYLRLLIAPHLPARPRPALALFRFQLVVLAALVVVVTTLLPIQTAAMRDIVANAYHGSATHGAVYTTAPGGTAGTEPSGGSPAYARKALSWAAGNAGTAVATFDIPASTTIVGAGVHSALTAGTYYDGASVTSQAFSSQGTYQVTFTFTAT